MRIGILIRALTVGGAERQVVTVARGLQLDGHVVHVLVFYQTSSFLEAELAASGIRVVELGKRWRWDLPGFLWRLHRVVRELDIDVVYSFLPTANVLAAILWARGPRPAVVWGVRGSSGERASHDWLGNLLVSGQNWLARRADAVIANSSPAIAGCRALDWPADRLHLVPNGIDGEAFRFDPAARDRLRSGWGVGPSQPVIGVAGRLDPVKGVDDFISALVKVKEGRPEALAVIAGDGPPGYAGTLRELAERLSLSGSIRWLGPVREMTGFYSAIDLLCLPSRSEGCSNVIAEALACGTPAVATRVGDNAVYVPDPSLLPEPGRPVELASAMLRALTPGRQASREALRRGILEQLASPVMVQRTLAVLRQAVSVRQQAPRR